MSEEMGDSSFGDGIFASSRSLSLWSRADRLRQHAPRV